MQRSRPNKRRRAPVTHPETRATPLAATASHRARIAEALRAQASTLVLLADALETEPATAPADDLVAIDHAPVERGALLRLAKDGKLAVSKIGRRKFVRRAELLALADAEAKPPVASTYSLADAMTRAARVACAMRRRTFACGEVVGRTI